MCKPTILLITLLVIVPVISIGQVISIPIKLINNFGESGLLNVGIDPKATDGIDPMLGESSLPPFPPGSIFDSRLKLPYPSLDYSLKDIRPSTSAPFSSTINYEIEFQPGNSSTVKLLWNFPKGATAKLSDKFNGIVINELLKDTGSFTITNMALNKLNLSVSYFLISNIDLSNDLPNSFILFQNYPNPFNPTTKIKFDLPEKMFITLNVYNSLGEKVTGLINRELSAGYHEVEWNAGIYCNGIYFYEIRSNLISFTKKMVYLK